MGTLSADKLSQFSVSIHAMTEASDPSMTPWPELPEPQVRTRVAAEHSGAANLFKPFVHDDGQVRSLHFTQGEIQSRMDRRSPWHLEVDYTRTMMGFLLFGPVPAKLAMIGLGGGSLAKFCYHQLRQCRLTVLENNPHVIALRRDFCVPEDDARFEVIEGDGAVFAASPPAGLNVFLVDGFDHTGQPPALCTQEFYDDCFTALAADGLLVVNLHHDDANYPVWAERIRRSFSGNVLEVPALEKSNCIVFASRGAPLAGRHIRLQNSLLVLDSEARMQLSSEFQRIARYLQDQDAMSR